MTIHRLTASQRIPRPIDEVFAFFSKPENLVRITPPGLGFERLTEDVGMRTGLEIDYRVRTHYDYERSRIDWKLDPNFDNDLQDIEGYWELYELDENRTLGKFGTRVSVGQAMPIWLQDYATRKNVPQTMDRMRRWVDSDGTYRP